MPWFNRKANIFTYIAMILIMPLMLFPLATGGAFMFISITGIINYSSLPEDKPEVVGVVLSDLDSFKYLISIENGVDRIDQKVELTSYFDLKIGDEVNLLYVNNEYTIRDHIKSFSILFLIGFLLFFGIIGGLVQVFVFKSAYLEWSWYGSFDLFKRKSKRKI